MPYQGPETTGYDQRAGAGLAEQVNHDRANCTRVRDSDGGESAAGTSLVGYSFDEGKLKRHNHIAYFSSTTQHAKINCNNFWHASRGHLVPAFALLRQAGMLHPTTVLLFESDCSKLLRDTYAVFFDEPPHFGVPLSKCPSNAARFTFDTRALEQPPGLLDCAAFDDARVHAGIRHLHQAAMLRLGLPARSSLLNLLVNFRSWGRDFTNKAAVLQALGAAANANDGTAFRAIDTGKHKITEQVRAFASADIGVLFHGAGISHVLWMRPDSLLIEVQPSNAWHCAGAFQQLPMTYVVSTTVNASRPGTCTPGRHPLNVTVTPTLCSQKCPMFDVAPGHVTSTDLWHDTRSRSRAVNVSALSGFVHGTLKYWYSSVGQVRLGDAPAVQQLPVACSGYARHLIA